MSEDEISDSEAASPDTVIERCAVSDRRRLSLRTFVQSGLTPRRRGGRRDGEHEHLIDWHEPDLLFLALAILLLSVTDAFFTLTLMTRGAEEANPLLALRSSALSRSLRGSEDGAHRRRGSGVGRDGARQGVPDRARTDRFAMFSGWLRGPGRLRNVDAEDSSLRRDRGCPNSAIGAY